MSKSLLELLACPSCGHSQLEYVVPGEEVGQASTLLGDVGLLICSTCERWYPIEDGIVRMLPDNLRVRAGDESFIDKHRDILGTRLCEQLASMNLSWRYSDDASRVMSYYDVPIRIAKDRTRNANHRFKFEEILRGIEGSGIETCLELACGNGTHAASILESYPTMNYVGIDISLMRLAETRECVGDRQNVLLVQATLQALPFRDESFSAVYAASVLQYLQNPQDGMNEARRVLEVNGSFTSLDYNPKCYASVFGLMRRKQKYDAQLDEDLYEKMSKENLGKWMTESRFSGIKIQNFLFLPGNLPLPIFVYRMMNRILKRVPFIKQFSIMLVINASKRDGLPLAYREQSRL